MASGAIVGLTVVLAIITAYYAYETRRIRQQALRPNLSLATDIYTGGGGIHELKLRNTGAVAREVHIDLEIKKRQDSDEIEKRAFYAPSIDKSQEIVLMMDLNDVKNAKGSVKARLAFTDASNTNITDTISMDFAEIAHQKRAITLQHSPLDYRMERIEDAIKKLEIIARNTRS